MKINFSKNIYNYLYILWFFPIVEFFFSNSLGNNLSIFIPTLFIAYFLYRGDYHIFINSIPFFILLAPLTHKISNFFLLSELIMIISSFLVIFIIYKKKFPFNYNFINFLLLGLFFVFVLSYLFSNEYSRLLKGLINAIFLSSTFLLTSTILKKKEDVDSFLKSIIFSACYASILMLVASNSNVNLNDFTQIIKLKSDYIPTEISQLSFFYTGIFFITSSALILTFGKILNEKDKFHKILFILIFILLLFTIGRQFNKTVFVSLFLIGLTYITIVSLEKFSLKNIIIFVLIFFILALFFKLQEHYSYRSISLASLKARYLVFSSAINVLKENPSILFLGLGPESLFRLGNHELILKAKSTVYGTEGAIDSAWLSYIFEYGIIFATFLFILFIYILYKLFKLIYKKKYLQDIYILSLFLIVLNIFIISTIQVIGIGKIACIISQILCCSLFLIKNYNSEA